MTITKFTLRTNQKALQAAERLALGAKTKLALAKSETDPHEKKQRVLDRLARVRDQFSALGTAAAATGLTAVVAIHVRTMSPLDQAVSMASNGNIDGAIAAYDAFVGKMGIYHKALEFVTNWAQVTGDRKDNLGGGGSLGL